MRYCVNSFDRYNEAEDDVIYFTRTLRISSSVSVSSQNSTRFWTRRTNEHTSRFEQLMMDPMEQPSHAERATLMAAKWSMQNDSTALPRVLSLIDWCDYKRSREAVVECLTRWAPPEEMLHILPLLLGRFSNYMTRCYAVRCLETYLDDSEITQYLPQLIMAAQSENHHWSPLAGFLLERATKNPSQVGFFLAWHLRAFLSDPTVKYRSSILLNALLSRCGTLRTNLDMSMRVFHHLAYIAVAISKMRDKGEHTDSELRRKLREALSGCNDILETIPGR